MTDDDFLRQFASRTFPFLSGTHAPVTSSPIFKIKMNRDYLGDSYDAVKRLWQQVLAGAAPLYAEPRFVPPELRDDFTRLTGIPILPERPPLIFSILNIQTRAFICRAGASHPRPTASIAPSERSSLSFRHSHHGALSTLTRVFSGNATSRPRSNASPR
jgi:hypothetical protein